MQHISKTNFGCLRPGIPETANALDAAAAGETPDRGLADALDGVARRRLVAGHFPFDGEINLTRQIPPFDSKRCTRCDRIASDRQRAVERDP